MAPLPRRAPRVVARHVCRHDEQPAARVCGLVDERPRERLLGEVLRTRRVPHLTVQEPHQGAVRATVHVGQVVGHRIQRRTRNWERGTKESGPTNPAVLFRVPRSHVRVGLIPESP